MIHIAVSNILLKNTFVFQRRLYVMNTINKISFIQKFNSITTLPIADSKGDRIKDEQKILQPFIHIYRSPSKQYIAMFKAINYWLNVPKDKLKPIEEFLLMIHTASLMIDDIQDDSTFRYGVPAAHCLYGNALTINAIHHAFALALKKIYALGQEPVEIYIQGVIDACEGQGIDIYYRDNVQCPSEKEYITVIKKKTSYIFVMAYKLMQIFSENKTDYDKITNLFSIYLQIRDDYVNLADQKHEDNKSFCSDITEGKFSFPVIHALQHSDSRDQIRNILKLRTRDPDLKNYCVSIIEKAGSFNYTKEKLRDLETQIYDEMARLGGNPLLTAIMAQLGDWKDDNAKYTGYTTHA